jgi:hypothetical protein
MSTQPVVCPSTRCRPSAGIAVISRRVASGNVRPCQISAALPADRDEGHEARLGQRIAPAMSGLVLHEARRGATLRQSSFLLALLPVVTDPPSAFEEC